MLADGKPVQKQDGPSHPDSKGEKCVCLHVLVCNLCVRVCVYVLRARVTHVLCVSHMCVCVCVCVCVRACACAVFSISTLMTSYDQVSCPNSDCSLGLRCYICR